MPNAIGIAHLIIELFDYSPGGSHKIRLHSDDVALLTQRRLASLIIERRNHGQAVVFLKPRALHMRRNAILMCKYFDGI
jgi:hypothetical protein